jgi:hypothetical protein
MFSFQQFLSEEVASGDFPEGVFGGLSIEKKSENSKTAVFVVRSDDRLSDRDEILRNLKQSGIKAEVREKAGQGVDPIFIDSHFDVTVILLIKPKSGGVGETTLNASITELFPAIAWETGYKMTTSVDNFYYHLLEQDPSKLKCVNPKDLDAAVATIQKASESSKFTEKMLNAMGVRKRTSLKGLNKSTGGIVPNLQVFLRTILAISLLSSLMVRCLGYHSRLVVRVLKNLNSIPM